VLGNGREWAGFVKKCESLHPFLPKKIASRNGIGPFFTDTSGRICRKKENFFLG
jgi:hypothetical protein